MTPDDDDAPTPDREATTADRDKDPRDREREKDRERAPDKDRDKDKDHDGLGESIRQRLEHLVPELVKKTFAAGMGAVFSTEEGIRKFAREVSLPDAVGGVAGYIADSADGAKDKVFEVIARETREFLSNLNISEEIAKILTTLSFEIKTEIRFIPNSDRFTGAEPDVKASVRLKRNDRPDSHSDAKDPKDPKRQRQGRRRARQPGQPLAAPVLAAR